MAVGDPLKVWFVNVGHGDCTIVKFPHSNRVMMIDISNCGAIDEESEKELLASTGIDLLTAAFLKIMNQPLPSEYAAKMKQYESLCDDPLDVLKTELPGESIFRFLLTHPDMDHMTGLYRLFQEASSPSVLNFWDVENSKGEADKKGAGYDPRDWYEYERIRNGSSENPKVLHLLRGAEGDYYTQDHIRILGPSESFRRECDSNEDWNNLSQVVRIQYGKASLLLPGDIEGPAQLDVLDAISTSDLKSTILKAPHHGRDTGYLSDFVSAVDPDYTIVSVGKKPESDASNKYRYHTKKKVLSTRFNGTIHAQLFEDGDVRLWNSKKIGYERIDEEGEKQAQLITRHLEEIVRGMSSATSG